MLIILLQSTMKHNETTELCLLCAYYLRLGACALLAPCSPQTVLSSKLRTVRHLVTALSHSLAPRVPPPIPRPHFFFPTTAPLFSTLRQPA